METINNGEREENRAEREPSNPEVEGTEETLRQIEEAAMAEAAAAEAKVGSIEKRDDLPLSDTDKQRLEEAKTNIKTKKAGFLSRIFKRNNLDKVAAGVDAGPVHTATAPADIKQTEAAWFREQPAEYTDEQKKEAETRQAAETQSEEKQTAAKKTELKNNYFSRALTGSRAEVRAKLDTLWDQLSKQHSIRKYAPKYEGKAPALKLTDVEKTLADIATPREKKQNKLYRAVYKKGEERLSTNEFASLDEDRTEERLTDDQYEQMKAGEIPWTMNAVFRATAELESGKLMPVETEKPSDAANLGTAVEAAAVAGAVGLGVAAAAAERAPEGDYAEYELKTPPEKSLAAFGVAIDREKFKIEEASKSVEHAKRELAEVMDDAAILNKIDGAPKENRRAELESALEMLAEYEKSIGSPEVFAMSDADYFEKIKKEFDALKEEEKAPFLEEKYRNAAIAIAQLQKNSRDGMRKLNAEIAASEAEIVRLDAVIAAEKRKQALAEAKALFSSLPGEAPPGPDEVSMEGIVDDEPPSPDEVVATDYIEGDERTPEQATAAKAAMAAADEVFIRRQKKILADLPRYERELKDVLAGIKQTTNPEKIAAVLVDSGYLTAEQAAVLNDEEINILKQQLKNDTEYLLKVGRGEIPMPVEAKKETPKEAAMKSAREVLKKRAADLAKAELPPDKVEDLAALVRAIGAERSLQSIKDNLIDTTDLAPGEKPYLTADEIKLLSPQDIFTLRDEIKTMYGAEVKRRDEEAKKAAAEGKEKIRTEALTKIRSSYAARQEGLLRRLDDTNEKMQVQEGEHFLRMTTAEFGQYLHDVHNATAEEIKELTAEDLAALRTEWVKNTNELRETLKTNRETVAAAIAEMQAGTKLSVEIAAKLTKDDSVRTKELYGRMPLTEFETFLGQADYVTDENKLKTLTHHDLETLQKAYVAEKLKVIKAIEDAHPEETAREKEESRLKNEAMNAVITKMNAETTGKDEAALSAALDAMADVVEPADIKAWFIKNEYITAEQAERIKDTQFAKLWEDRNDILEEARTEIRLAAAAAEKLKAIEAKPKEKAEAEAQRARVKKLTAISLEFGSSFGSGIPEDVKKSMDPAVFDQIVKVYDEYLTKKARQPFAKPKLVDEYGPKIKALAGVETSPPAAKTAAMEKGKDEGKPGEKTEAPPPPREATLKSLSEAWTEFVNAEDGAQKGGIQYLEQHLRNQLGSSLESVTRHAKSADLAIVVVAGPNNTREALALPLSDSFRNLMKYFEPDSKTANSFATIKTVRRPAVFDARTLGDVEPKLIAKGSVSL